MASAGRRDTLIDMQSALVTTDDHNEETSDWSTVAQEWAAVFWGRGDERRQAASEQNVQAATFQVLSNERTRAVTIAGSRIAMADGSRWDIQGIAPIGRGEIEFTAVRSAE